MSSRSRRNAQDDYWNQLEVDLSTSSSQAMMPYKQLQSNIYEFIKNGVKGTDNKRQLTDLDESLRNIPQLPIIEDLGLDAKEALLEIIDTELTYLNGRIIIAEANEKIKALCLRVDRNTHMVNTIAKSISAPVSVIAAAGGFVFYSHWNNFQSILVGMCDLFKQEAFDIAGLPAIIESISTRTDIYYLLTSNSLLDFFYNLIFPTQANAQQQQVLLQQFALDQSRNMIDSVQENSWWSIFPKMVKGGVNTAKRVLDWTTGDRSARVKHELSNKIDYLFITADSAYTKLLYFVGLFLLCFFILIIYKGWRYYGVNKTLSKHDKKALEEEKQQTLEKNKRDYDLHYEFNSKNSKRHLKKNRRVNEPSNN